MNSLPHRSVHHQERAFCLTRAVPLNHSALPPPTPPHLKNNAPGRLPLTASRLFSRHIRFEAFQLASAEADKVNERNRRLRAAYTRSERCQNAIYCSGNMESLYSRTIACLETSDRFSPPVAKLVAYFPLQYPRPHATHAFCSVSQSLHT